MRSTSAYMIIIWLGKPSDRLINSGKLSLRLGCLRSTILRLPREFLIYFISRRRQLKSESTGLCMFMQIWLILYHRTKSMVTIIMRYALISGALTRYAIHWFQLFFWPGHCVSSMCSLTGLIIVSPNFVIPAEIDLNSSSSCRTILSSSALRS